jgi:hypothetical protein
MPDEAQAAEFLVTGPQGRKFKVTVPPGATADDVAGLIHKNFPQKLNPPTASAGEAFKTGFMDPFIGAGEMSVRAVGNPAEQARVDREMQEREAGIRARSGPGFDVARAAGSAVNPINLMGAGGAARGVGGRIVSGAMAGAMGGATQPTTGQNFTEEKAAQVGLGAASGAALGGLPALARPIQTPAARQRLTNVLDREDIRYTAGQGTGSRTLRYLESHLGEMPGAGGASQRADELSQADFNRWALRSAGVDAERADQPTIARMWNQLDARYHGITARNDLQLDAAALRAMQDAYNQYQWVTPDSQRRGIVGRLMQDITQAHVDNNGLIDGRVYQNTRSTLHRLGRSETDPETSAALHRLGNVLDDAFERTAQRTGSRDLGAFRTLREHYRNALAVQDAIGVGGEANNVVPSKLRAALIRQDKTGYRSGARDMAEVTDAAEQILPKVPQSGTAPRVAVHGMTSAIGAALGAAAGHGVDPSGGVGAALAGSLAPGIAGRTLHSRPMQDFLMARTAPQQALQYRFPNAVPPSVFAPAAGSALAQPDDPLQ